MKLQSIALRIASSKNQLNDVTEEIAKEFREAKFNIPESTEKWAQKSSDIDWKEAEDLLVRFSDYYLSTSHNNQSAHDAFSVGLEWTGPCYVVQLGSDKFFFNEQAKNRFIQEISMKAAEHVVE
jgi:hypothetical protein